MNKKLSLLRKNTLIVFSSVVISFVFVAIITYAATTISTNVNTGGTLTVSGASNLNGNATFGDAVGDVILSTGGFQASSTALFGGNLTTYANSTFGDGAGDINIFTGILQASTTALFGAGSIFYGAVTVGDANADTFTMRAGDLTFSSTATSTVAMTTGLNFDSNTFVIDPNSNRVGVLTATPSYDFHINGNFGVGTTTMLNGASLTLGSIAANPAGASGMIYYNTSSNKVFLYNGTSWGVIGTSTGLDLIGSNIRMVTPSSDYFTLGTTTAQGASLLTVEATSTVAIPLTLVGRAAQTANTFQIRDATSANLLYINSAGGIFGSSTAQFTGALTTYGSDVLGDAIGDVLTVTGGRITMSNLATTTIPTTAAHNIWSIATSTTITPILSVSGISSPNGRVGIGTVAPNTTLEVIGAASSTSLVVGSGITNLYGELRASSTSLFTGALTTYGGVTVGDATGDTLTVNAGTVSMANNSTTTIPNTVATAWSVATSTSITPTFTISTLSSPAGRIGIGTTTPETTLSVAGSGYLTGGLGVGVLNTTAGSARVSGATTLDGNVTLGDTGADLITINGNASTTGAVTIGTLASTTQLVVGGDGTNGTISGLVFGYCSFASVSVTASSTNFAVCADANGINTNHRVFVQATSSLASDFIITAASSTATNIISVRIWNTGRNGITDTARNSLNFIGIR